MKASLFRQAMDGLRVATGQSVFTFSTLRRTVLQQETLRVAERTVAAAVRNGDLHRLCRGAFLHWRGHPPGECVMEELALCVRPRNVNYVSLETALSGWGVIDQQMMGHVSVMTTGSSQTFNTNHGTLELTHTKKSIEQIEPFLVKPDDMMTALPWAKPKFAASELVRLGRNVDLIQWDDLEDIEREVEDRFAL